MSWIIIFKNYAALPASIPIHYGLAGNVDKFGPKNMIWILPIISSIIYVGLTILNRYPHLFNYLVPITPTNAAQQYTLATRLIRYIKFLVVLIFGHTVYLTMALGNGYDDNPSPWFMPLCILLLFATLIYYIIQSSRKK